MILFIFILGLFIGSFLNVLADRLPNEESVLKGRSRCEKCKKELVWYDLVPVLSFVFLQGKCRYCHTNLSSYYPIIELVTGIMFAITFLFVTKNLPFTIYHLPFIELFYYLFIISFLIVIFFADLKYGIIPDKVVLPAIFVSSLYIVFNTNYLILSHLLSALGACLFFLFLFLITKGRGMGLGDVKLAFLMGFLLGFPGIVIALYLAFLTGALVGIILILWRKKRLFGGSIPFGPFLVLGTGAALFYQAPIVQMVSRWLSFSL